MSKQTKKIFAWVMTFAMLLSLLPAAGLTALAATTAENVQYIDADGVEQTCVSAEVVETSASRVTWNTGWYVVNSDVTITGGADVSGEVHLILADGASLTISGVAGNLAGICVSGDGNSLTIYGQSKGTGNLTVTGGYYGAGIGGCAGGNGNGSKITINGGEVTANGGSSGAGIGGGRGGSGSEITINGGSVTANGGLSGAGIGGGCQGSGSYITINGGTVTANGGDYGAGIGGGNYGGAGSEITINGGSVTANGGLSGAGIGGGRYGSGSDIKIATTLTVKAGSSENPAEVIENDGKDLADELTGRYATVTPPVSYLSPMYNTKDTPTSGLKEMETKSCTEYTEVTDSDTKWNSGWYVVTGTVEIKNSVTVSGNVNLILADGASLTISNAGICVTGDNSLTIYGQSEGDSKGELTVTGGYGGAGIGGEISGNGSNITINGGKVTANGGDHGAGIGGGWQGSGSNITINGGSVTATGVGGADGGAGIGGGSKGSGSYITINGGSVTATGVEGGAGIGGGNQKDGSNITINGGEVTANGGSNGAGIGNGASCTTSASTIKIATTLTVKAGTKTPPTEEIENKGDDLAESLKESRYVKVEKGVAHTHTFTYTADGATLTAVCTSTTGTCTLTNKQVSLTLTKPALTKYGGSESAEATLSGQDAWKAAGLSVPTINYQKQTGTNPETYGDATTTAPTDAGTYKASIAAEGKTASVVYAIAKAQVDVPTAQSFTYDGDKKTALTIAEGALYELDSSVEDGKIKATDAGNYSFYVKLKDTNNYEWKLETPTSDSQQITWSISKAEVAVPTAETNLVYDGKVQTGVPAGDLYDIENNTEIAAGGYTAVATLTDSTNYKWSTGDAETATRDIPWSIARLAVTLWSETASKDYDGTALTAPTVYADSSKTAVDSVFANEVTGLEATGSVTDVSQGTVTNEITYTFNKGCSEDNYSITKTEGKLTITRAGTMGITGSDYTGVYDGEAHKGTATPTVTEGTTVTYSIDDGTTWSETVPQITDVGTLTVQAKAENDNYATVTSKSYTLTVSQFTENTITGLTCENIKKDETPAPTATATFGEITYSYSKDGETWGDWESIYSESGEYQVKAVVAETANYNGCESEPVTFRVGYVCEGWKIVKFDELNPGQYKMYLNNTDTGVYNFAMVVGGYTIQDAETGKYICLENGQIVMKDTTNPTAWAKGIASFHASAVSTGRWGFSTRYYLNVDRDGNLIADRLPGITHFATYVEADEHEYYVHSNFNSTHTHTCIVCGDSYEEDCTPNRWNFCTECGGYVKSGSSWWKW